MELCLKAVVHQLREQAAQRFPRGRALFDLTGNGLEVGLEHLHAAEGQIIREMVDPIKQVQDVRVRLTGLFHICFQFLGRTSGEERIHCCNQVHQVVQARAVPHNGTVALELRVKHFFGLNHADVLEVAGYNEQQRRRIAHSAGQVDVEVVILGHLFQHGRDRTGLVGFLHAVGHRDRHQLFRLHAKLFQELIPEILQRGHLIAGAVCRRDGRLCPDRVAAQGHDLIRPGRRVFPQGADRSLVGLCTQEAVFAALRGRLCKIGTHIQERNVLPHVFSSPSQALCP